MAKKLPWGSFSHEDLVINDEDDIYTRFPFLSLVGLTMVKLNELRIGDNAVRGIKDTVNQKLVGLSGSLFYGWDRTSWPVPFFKIETSDIQDKEAFDRRHTVKVCRSISDTTVQKISEIPGAEYKRECPENGGIFNRFLNHSILTMAAMWGNVYGPISEDTKDYMFETACVHIIRDEIDRHDEDLLTRTFVRNILSYMGCYTRYNNNNTVIERIVTKVLDALRDPETVVGQPTQNNNIEDLENFIDTSDDWGRDNTVTDTHVFITITTQDNKSLNQTYAEKLLTRVCAIEKKNPEKIVKVIIYNKENSNNSKKIVASRLKFKEALNHAWYTRRDNILSPVEQILNKDMVPRKTLSDLNLEIWNMNQLEDEDEPIEMVFDERG
mgnify:FL=1|tara:strand:- start:55 stop:1200 length:1146 start_codon:yes stop_codon:yes gene_type:complete